MLKNPNSDKILIANDTSPTWGTPFGPHMEVATNQEAHLTQYIEI